MVEFVETFDVPEPKPTLVVVFGKLAQATLLVPYLNHPFVAVPFGFIVPFILAVVPVILSAGLVATVGGAVTVKVNVLALCVSVPPVPVTVIV